MMIFFLYHASKRKERCTLKCILEDGPLMEAQTNILDLVHMLCIEHWLCLLQMDLLQLLEQFSESAQLLILLIVL